MKKILALILAAMMLATTAAVVASAEETTSADVVETGAVEEETGEENVPTGPVEPLVYGNFTISLKDLVKASENTELSLTDGVLQMRPVDNDVWNSEDDGDWVDARVKVAIDWHVRDGYRNGLYTAEKVIVKKEMKYIAVKVKQQDNFAEEMGMELTLYVADPKAPRVDSGYPIYSLTTIQGEDGFSYLLFDISACEDANMFYNQMVTSAELLWASCEVANRETAYMDLYEIAILKTDEELDAYVGTDVEWVTEPERPPMTETVDDGDETTTEEEDGGILAMLGCKGTIASAAVLVVATVAAGAVVCKKRKD